MCIFICYSIYVQENSFCFTTTMISWKTKHFKKMLKDCHQILKYLLVEHYRWQYWQLQISVYWPWASLVAQTVKNLPAMRETHVRSLSGGDRLEKEMGTHSSILAWRSPWTEEPGDLQSMGSQRVGHHWVSNILTRYLINWMNEWTDGWMTGWMDWWMVKHMKEWLNMWGNKNKA